MSLYIQLNDINKVFASLNEPAYCLESIHIAGKEIIVYWLEWARYKGLHTLTIQTNRNCVNSDKIEKLQNLYGIEISFQDLPTEKEAINEEETYTGLGVFLDNGTYKRFENLNEILQFEQTLLSTPLEYSPHTGYTKSDNLHIGKNVYIHKSAKLSGNVLIGDNCIIEKDVTISNSVIGENCTIKEKSTVVNSHIDENITMITNLYLQNKALFKTCVYDTIKKKSIANEGLFISQ
jgi:NDP-sugar pyrophosphorylase family protein